MFTLINQMYPLLNIKINCLLNNLIFSVKMLALSPFTCSIVVFENYLIERASYQKIKKEFLLAHKDKITFIDISNNLFQYNSFMKREPTHSPVIRIYGTTKLGQKCCVNIHNFFPFFYIEITNKNFFNFESEKILQQFAMIVENAFFSYKSQAQSQYDNQRTQIIHKITKENLLNLYGYYNQKNIYLKIECYDPKDIKDLIDIFHSGIVMGKFFQCYDAHISHSIHFFSRFKLCGMGDMTIKNFTVRYPIKNTKKRNLFFEENIIWTYNENISIEDRDNKIYDMNDSNKFTFNTFAKNAKSDIEIDCFCDDIVTSIDSPAQNYDNNLFEDDASISLSNLHHHIEHCESLIDLWKEEIFRRNQLALPPLKYEPISNQGVFTLTENFLLTHKEISTKLIRFNFSFTEQNEIDIANAISNDIFICENKIKIVVNDKDLCKYKFKEQYTHSYAWYKKHYTLSLFDKEDNDEDIFEIFKPKRSANEQSFNLSSRAAIKSIMTTKTIDECLYEDEENDISKNYQLLRKKKQNDNKSYLILYKNLNLYATNEILTAKRVINQLKDEHYFYDTEVNANLNNLFYSNSKDYDLFKATSYKVNEKRSEMMSRYNHSVKLFVEKHNKIVKQCAYPICDDISSRRKKIKNLIHKEENELKVLKHSVMTFMWSDRRVTYKDVEDNIKEKQKEKEERNEYDRKYLNRIYKRKDDDLLHDEMRNLSLYNNSYYNEISPITEKKINKITYITNENNTKTNPTIVNNDTDLLDKSLRLTLMSIEVMADTSSNYGYDITTDEIISVHICIDDSTSQCYHNLLHKPYHKYNLIVTSQSNKSIVKRYNNKNFILSPEYFSYKQNELDLSKVIEVLFVKDEICLLMKVAEIILKYDPDIIAGFDTEKSSIGYIVNRAEWLGYPFRSVVSRNGFVNEIFTEEFLQRKINEKKNERLFEKVENKSYDTHKEIDFMFMKFGKVIKIKGRIILNVWRILESELKLTDYSFENIYFSTFKNRIHKFPYQFLLSLYTSNKVNKISYVLHHFSFFASSTLELLNEHSIITQSSQFIRIYGIDFESALTRGTQYRVEGVLARIAYNKGFVLLSASPKQRMSQNPPMFTPIVIEPPKNIFFNPVVVLDFQSLYPSIMIGYNICYSTCLGKLKEDSNWVGKEKEKKFGVGKYPINLYDILKEDFDLSKNEISAESIENFIVNNTFLAPNQVLYVRKNLREGILPIILKELLLTRIMVKRSMKLYSPDSTTYKHLHSRQLGIKLLANVIYGYTSAGFSGRMPNSEIGDTIVSLGKTIVLSSTKFIEENPKWNAKVIYGDTDSMFVSIANASVKEAIKIGNEMAEEITKRNPEPIKLQFEKVYCPLVFNSKKHYAGYKWETESQSEINLDTKGIENVRRDTCEAVSKTIEKIIKILFQKKDLSLLKQSLYTSFDKIISGKVISKEFIFSKSVKFGTYRGDNAPPSATVAFNLYKKDKNFFPSYGQRVPFLVYNNPLGERTLVNSVISPDEFFSNSSYTINCDYYIETIMKVVNRFLEPVGVDVFDWYKKYRRPRTEGKNVYSECSSEGSSQSSESFLKSKYKLVFNSKSKNIEEFFKEKEKKKEKTVRTFKEKAKELVMEESEEDERYGILVSKIERETKRKKRFMFNLICRQCSGFNNFNIDIEEVPCVNYQCKIFYEKKTI